MLTTPEIICESAQTCRLREVLPGWIKRVPLYRNGAYRLAFLNPDEKPENGLRELPLITKENLRQDFPRNFLGEGPQLDELLERNLVELEHTSGTAEERTALLLPQGWWSAQEELALRQNGIVARALDEFPQARRVTINSPVCGGEICYTTVPSQAERIVGNALHTSLSRFPFLWNEAELKRMAEEALAWQPIFLDVDPVYGVIFAQFCERHGISLPSLRFIICSYEFVSVVHRRILERVFGVPVFNLYGTTETGHLLMENENAEMTPTLDTAFLEVVELDANKIGTLVATTLTNDYMPLIRYRTSDLVERQEHPYHTVYVVHGRERDAFTSQNGGRVTSWHIDKCFENVAGIAHYQLIQRDKYELSFVADGAGPSAEELDGLKNKITSALGIREEILIQRQDFLLAEGSGKFRLGYPQRQSLAI